MTTLIATSSWLSWDADKLDSINWIIFIARQWNALSRNVYWARELREVVLLKIELGAYTAHESSIYSFCWTKLPCNFTRRDRIDLLQHEDLENRNEDCKWFWMLRNWTFHPRRETSCRVTWEFRNSSISEGNKKDEERKRERDDRASWLTITNVTLTETWLSDIS